jgi:hypothetical protein|nr:MAG TPA: Transcriptional regulator protein (SplA) [Caudoviricetes sp.]
MERLTIHSKNSDMVWFKDAENSNARLEPCEMTAHHNRMALDKLATYEDLEEQGRLIKLPCKVGDTVYVIVGKNISVQKIQRATIDSEMKIEFCTKRRGLALFDIGKTVFLTKSEAEAKLKELRGGENE